jgi:hypothetical protein
MAALKAAINDGLVDGRVKPGHDGWGSYQITEIYLASQNSIRPW